MTKKTLGYAMAAYFGGRSEVRVRRVDPYVAVVDFTSMYPTIFVLQNLQAFAASNNIRQRTATRETRKFLASVTLEMLYETETWRLLNRIALVRPQGDILPVRMRMRKDDPFTIAVTPFTSSTPRWYTLADLVAAKLLGGKIPEILKAIEFSASGNAPELRPVDFLGMTLDPSHQIMISVIEERQRARKAGPDNIQAARRELALKLFANSFGYGINAEINVAPEPARRAGTHFGGYTIGPQRVWYSDVGPIQGKAPNERPGRFFSPLLASLVTGGARLMLATAEKEITDRGGTFAFCDTDSLAIVVGSEGPPNVPRLTYEAVAEIIAKFDSLNPYDRTLVPHLLKWEYRDIPDLQCYATSAKRYLLFTINRKGRIRIVKASESGIGATIGRSKNETVRKLARRIWMSILIRELELKYRGVRKRRLAKLLDFDVAMRRKLPIAQPSVHDVRGFREFNRGKSYDFRIKPFSFLQTITPAIEVGESVRPIAPFERDLEQSRKLPWTNLKSGSLIELDWDGDSREGSIPVMRMSEFIDAYARHPESKAAGPDGLPAGEETRGVLGRLHLCDGPPIRIGKEIDRLDEGENYSLYRVGPAEYTDADELTWALRELSSESDATIAPQVGMSERRYRDIRKGRSRPHSRTREAIVRLARSRAATKARSHDD